MASVGVGVFWLALAKSMLLKPTVVIRVAKRAYVAILVLNRCSKTVASLH